MSTTEADVLDPECSSSATAQMAMALRNLQHAVTHSREAIFVTDAAGIITRVNPAFEKLTGYSSLEAKGKDLSALTAGGPQSKEYRGMWEQIFQQRVFSAPLELRLKHGLTLPVEITITPVHDSRGHLTNLVCNCADSADAGLTEISAAGLVPGPAARAKEIGRELNNLLMTVLAHAELAFEAVPADHPVKARLRGIKTAARRAVDLIRLLHMGIESRIESELPSSGIAAEKKIPTDACFAAEESMAQLPNSGNQTGPATVLVVEEDELVRESMIESLSRQEYHVLSASNAEDALAKSKVHTGRIDLVVTDVALPGMNGRQLAAELKAFRPEIKIMFVSDDSETTMLWRDASTLNRSFLKKPFSFETLSEKINGILKPQQPKVAVPTN